MNSEVITVCGAIHKLPIGGYQVLDLEGVHGVLEENFYLFSVRGLSPDLNIFECRVLRDSVIRLVIDNNSGKNVEEHELTVCIKQV